jgi:hypothetical protein
MSRNSETPDVGRRFRWVSAHATRILFELVIVFVGVLGAFVAENYRKRHEAEDNARQVYRGILAEVNDHRRFLRGAVDSINAGLTGWDSAYASGRKPAPYVYRIWGSEFPPEGAWNAALSQAAELREPELLITLSAYYNEQIGISNRYVRYATFVESEILPYNDSPLHFYQPASGRIAPEYLASMQRLRELAGFWTEMLTLADTLAKEIERVVAQ